MPAPPSFTGGPSRVLTRQSTTLATRFRFLNPRPDPTMAMYSTYDGIARARGLDPITPFFASNATLRTIDTGSVITRGMTPTVFYLDFSTYGLNWHAVERPGDRRRHVQFGGGEIKLCCIAAVFIDERARFQRRAIEKILEHELDHAAGYKAALAGQAPAAVQSQSLVQDYLVRQQPLLESDWQTWFGSAQEGDVQRRAQTIVEAARSAGRQVSLLDTSGRDSLASRRWIDSMLFVQVWKQLAERQGAALHRDPAHIQTMQDVSDALDAPADSELYQEHHGRIPPNVG